MVVWTHIDRIDPIVAPVAALGAFADRHAIPVICYRPRYVCLPGDHPMHLGYEPARAVQDADVIVTLESDVPWIPSLHKVNPDAKIVQVGADPLFARYPIRGFNCDLAITSDARLAVAALDAAMGKANANGADARRQLSEQQ